MMFTWHHWTSVWFLKICNLLYWVPAYARYGGQDSQLRDKRFRFFLTSSKNSRPLHTYKSGWRWRNEWFKRSDPMQSNENWYRRGLESSTEKDCRQWSYCRKYKKIDVCDNDHDSEDEEDGDFIWNVYFMVNSLPIGDIYLTIRTCAKPLSQQMKIYYNFMFGSQGQSCAR